MVTPASFVVMSIVKGGLELKAAQKLINSFPKVKFYLYYKTNDEDGMTNEEFDMFNHRNVVTGQYGADYLVGIYKGTLKP
jgi:basic membrane lipoprotein Med (substrate-binding protein (PBP1-ABC) superfamily)